MNIFSSQPPLSSQATFLSQSPLSSQSTLPIQSRLSQLRSLSPLSLAVISATFFVSATNATDLVSHDFNDGELSSFVECTSKSPSYTEVQDGRVVTYWDENGYNGSRVSKGTEACVALDNFQSTKESWMGFTINIDESHRNDTQSGIAQIFQFVEDSNIYTWTGMLKYEEGDLVFVRRSGSNTTSQVNTVVVKDFVRGEDHEVVIHYILSNNEAGEIEIWVDGVKEYGHYDINFGFGNFNSDDEQYDDTYVELKFGQYNYQTDEYNTDEERIIYYDNVTYFNGEDGYSVVQPEDEKVSLIQLSKYNAPGFAIDGNAGGEDGQDVYLWTNDITNRNQRWFELDRANGYYSYQKYGTDYCLDGGKEASNGQNVYLWSCEDNNQNQQWKKVYTSKSTYRLEKRNAPGFAIDGNKSGEDGQSIYLWTIGESNQNQQWIFTELN